MYGRTCYGGMDCAIAVMKVSSRWESKVSGVPEAAKS
jgi:hypothetical protein